MVDIEPRAQKGVDDLPDVVDSLSAGIWTQGLLKQAQENGGKVTIQIPSLGISFDVTQEELEGNLKKTP